MHDTASSSKPHLFTVAEYMALAIDGRTELLGGVIYDVSPKNEPHSHALRSLNRALTRGLGDGYVVSIQDPIAVEGWAGSDAPEIDLAVIADKSYPATPTAQDAFAFVEISDTTYGGLRGDRSYKVPLYVRAGVASWIVNISLRQVEAYRTVADLDLKFGRVFREGETFEILGVSIVVSDLF